MRVLFATAELSPVASVGGLAAAAAGLTAELRRQGVSVDIVMPDYGRIALADETAPLDLDVPAWAGPAHVRTGEHPVVGRLQLVTVPGIARPHPYLQPDGQGWPDNDERFLAFSRAVAAMAVADPPDLLHLNDWHTAAALAAFRVAPPSVLSLHNLAYQGITDGAWLDLIGPRGRHYEWWGNTNPLSGGIALADAIVAVSPTYAKEILTPEGGFGLAGPLRFRGSALVGILNGIDTDIWDPARDPALVANYAAGEGDVEAAKEANRRVLLDRLGFPDDGTTLAVMATRLTHQKGVDLVIPIVPALRHLPVRLAILGSGDAELAATLTELAAEHSHSFAFVDGYDEQLSHLMFAAGDLYLMPSRFEPCGLTQMQAMRYGTVPVVTPVGGLIDTVPDADVSSDGRGFVADRVEPVAVVSALLRAVRHHRDRRRRPALIKRIMGIDWSWRGPAAEHIELYGRLLR
jgi:starch synthase